jgi:hypothetical protein
MKNCFAAIGVFLSSVIPSTYAQAQMTPEAAEALQRPVAVEREEAATSVPLIPHMGKLAVDATINGEERRFIFDTGSPTMISRELAEELELEVIGSNIGRDANGREFKTDIAIIDRLAIGGATFRSVPVLIADFGISDPNRCFFDGGVIGSEVFPGSVWHIDAERQTLDIAVNIEALNGSEPTGPVIAARLHDFGYPHAPIFDYSIGGLADRGLFDTGNSDTVTLFDRVAQDGSVQRAMIQGSVREGRGSHGVSAAGRGKDTDLLRFELEGMRLGETELGRQSGTTRSAPPSLMGLGILDTHSVTLDYTEARLLLHPRSQPEPSLPHPGYALMATDGIRVVQLFQGSNAQQAGLQLGDRVMAIVDHEVPLDKVSCETKQWLIEARPTYSAGRLTVLRDGKQVEINLDRTMEGSH